MRASMRGLITTLAASALVVPVVSSPVRAGDAPLPDESAPIPGGVWDGAIFLDGTRTSSGLSAVGQQTDIFQQIDSASFGVQATVGSDTRTAYVEAGTATGAINWSESGTFGSRTVSETGTLQISGDLTRFEVAGELERALSASDSEGNPIGSVSGTTVIEVKWVFELVTFTCGLFEYRFSEDSTGGSIMWFAHRPRQETTSTGFDVTHDLSVRAVLRAPGGPDFVDLATALQQTEDVVESVVADPSGQNVDLLLAEIAALEKLRSDFIAAGTCVTGTTFLADGLSLLQQLITQLLGVILEQGELSIEVLIDVLGIGVRVGAIAPGSGGPGQELFDAVGAELGEWLATAIESDDLDLINFVYVVAAQYGYDELAATANDAAEAAGADE